MNNKANNYSMFYKKISGVVFFFMFVIQVMAQLNSVQIKQTDNLDQIINKAANVVPTERQLRWQKLELTAFLHFGMNTFTGKEWGTGKEDPMLFNPDNLDANQWVKVLRDAGFKQVIITAKHHDGFCLWPSKTTKHSVVSSPWKAGQGDVVKEVAMACKKYKVGFGVYLSPWDMNAKSYGTENYNTFFEEQLTELLTQYGKVDEVWFDGANGEGPNGKKQVYDFDSWYRIIRKIQPDAVIAIMGPDVRWVGTETGRGRETEWSVLPASNLTPSDIADHSQKGLTIKPMIDKSGDDIGSRENLKNAQTLVWYPAETDVSIRPGWFYHDRENGKVKTAQQLTDIYFTSVGRNGVLLLNIPPNKKGLIQSEDSIHLMQWHEMRNRMFKVNLASSASVKLSSGKNAIALTDNKYNTYWTTATIKDTSATITFTFSKKQNFDVLLLQEQITVGQRIEKFVAEYWDGEKWTQFTEGTTVGYKRLLRFSPVSSNKVRLKILSSRLNPTLSEVGFYKQAVDEEF